MANLTSLVLINIYTIYQIISKDEDNEEHEKKLDPDSENNLAST